MSGRGNHERKSDIGVDIKNRGNIQGMFIRLVRVQCNESPEIFKGAAGRGISAESWLIYQGNCGRTYPNGYRER